MREDLGPFPLCAVDGFLETGEDALVSGFDLAVALRVRYGGEGQLDAEVVTPGDPLDVYRLLVYLE